MNDGQTKTYLSAGGIAIMRTARLETREGATRVTFGTEET